MKVKIALILSCVAFASSVSAMAPTPPSTEVAAANLAKAGPIETLDLSQLAEGIDNGALNSEAITAAFWSGKYAIAALLDDAKLRTQR